MKGKAFNSRINVYNAMSFMILSALQCSRTQKKGTDITLNFYEDRISFSFTAFKIVIFYSVFRHWSLIEVIPTASKLYSGA